MLANQLRRIAVFGASGHGKVVIDAINDHPLLELICVADDNPALQGSLFHAQNKIISRELLLAQGAALEGVIVAIGINRTRMQLASWFKQRGISLMCVIHPAATISSSALLGDGTLVMPKSVVNADVRMGENVIVNSGAIIEHDCHLGDGVHVAPGAVLCGNVSVGEGAFVGAGAVVVPGVKIAPDAFIKAGTIVKRDWSES
jgi:sugar O-acyltransferase (sialic acid O-acetyltransferase NeuD family)